VIPAWVKLIEAGLLTEPVLPQQKNKIFEWSILDQTWQMAVRHLPTPKKRFLFRPRKNRMVSPEPTDETQPDGEFGLGLGDKSTFITTYPDLFQH